MSTKKFSIRSILRAHLLEVNDLPPIEWENQNFEPGDETYIQEILISTDETLTANDERTAIGMYRLELFVPVNASISDAENLADELKQHFRPAQVVEGLKIEKSVVLQGVPEAPWYRIPVQIDYRAHQLNTED